MSNPLYSGKRVNPYIFILIAVMVSILPIIWIELTADFSYHVFEKQSYLLFHNVAESFSIMVSFSIFGLGWFSYPENKDQHSVFFSTAFIAIGLIDFMHMLAYPGMPDLITPNSANKSTQFWIIVRFFSACIFLISSFLFSVQNHPLIRLRLLTVSALIISLLAFLSVIFFQPIMPVTFSPDSGLTPTKIYAEYIIIIILIIAFFRYWKVFKETNNPEIPYYLAAFIFCIFSELAFTGYHDSFDTYNVLGHIYKILAFLLIYRGIFSASIKKPYHQLIQINHQLQIELSKIEEADQQIKESLAVKENLLREIYHRTKNTLQVVRGLFSLQAAEYKPNNDIQDLVQKTDSRIQAISLVHQMLYSTSNLSKLSIKSYINELCPLIVKSYENPNNPVTIETNIDDDFYLLDVAIPIGLILNELITNSMKYAFNDVKKGHISISLTRFSETEEILTYTDNGHGFDIPNKTDDKRPLGLLLIQQIGEKQLQGQSGFDSGDGFKYTLRFPNSLYSARV